MRTVYKYRLTPDTEQTIQVPGLIGTSDFKEQVLKIDLQYNVPCLWCLVDDSEPARSVSLLTVGTGNSIPDSLTKDAYLGTYMAFEGLYVGHVFWLK